MFPVLEVIVASFNQLTSVNFSQTAEERRDKRKKKKRQYPFAKLKKLDLQNNHLEKFPNLTACGKLRKLHLNGNYIKEISSVDKTQNPLLKELDIARNELYIPDNDHLCAFILELRSYPELKKLNIEQNPILSEEPEFGLDDFESQDLLFEKILEEFIIEYRRRPGRDLGYNFKPLSLEKLNHLGSKEFMAAVRKYDEMKSIGLKRELKAKDKQET